MAADDILQKIAKDREHGASLLLNMAFEAVYAFVQDVLPLPEPQRYIQLRGFTLKLLRARPSMAPIIRLANDLNILWDESQENLMDFEAKVKTLESEIHAAEEKAVSNALGALGRFSYLLTHSYSSTVARFLIQRRPHQVFCTESYPGQEGLELAKVLHTNGIQVSLVTDTGVVAVLGQAQCVVVGADAFSNQGVVNKAGTQILATWAHEHRLPVYVLTTTYKGLSEDLLTFHQPQETAVNQPDGSVGIPRVAPLFDETPWKWITAMITEKGITYPSAIHELLSDIQVHPVLESLMGTELS